MHTEQYEYEIANTVTKTVTKTVTNIVIVNNPKIVLNVSILQ